MNNLLLKFNAGFTIEEIEVKHFRGTPRAEYGLQVMGETISASSAERSVGVTLSSGDRKTLALAFFLARLKLDPQLNQRIVVIDDPVSSLDSGRIRATYEVLAEFATRCAQLIILSHDPVFLKNVLEHVDKNRACVLRLRRRGEYSVIEACDIYRMCRDEYYTLYESLVRYLEEGPVDNESQVAGNIRLYLEHNLRTRFPIELERKKNLGEMIACIREDPQKFGEFAEHIKDLEKLNDFSSPYHHMASDRPPPPPDAELRPMVELALKIGRGV